MSFKINFCISLLLSFNAAQAQSSSDSLLRLGNLLYKQQQYEKAAIIFEQSAIQNASRLMKKTYYSYAASAYASARDSLNSFRCLELAVYKLGFNDLPSLKNDDAYHFMRASKRWKKLIRYIKPPYTTDPYNVKIVSSDVDNFWMAYDAVQNTPANAEKIYMDNYTNKGTTALQF